MQILGNMIKLDILVAVAFTLIGLLFLKPILTIFGASEQTLPFAYDYMLVLLGGSVFTHCFLGLNDVLRASGHPKKAMAAMLLTVVVNCVLDAWFIFGLGWGIIGAAVATIAAQVVGLAVELHHFLDKRHFVHFDRHYMKTDFGIIREIIAIGLSPFFLNVCSCLIITLINNGLVTHGGDIYVGAYGIVNRFGFLIQMSVAGFNQGMQPIAGYNLGARQFDRVTKVLKYTICCATAVTTLGFVGGVFFPDTIAALFTDDEELVGIAHHAMQVCFLLFPVVGFQMVTTSFFQAVRQAKKAIFLSTTRQMLLLIPLLLVLPNFFGTDGVWMSMPISDAISSIIAGVLLFLQFRSFARKHREEMANIEPLSATK